MGVHGFCSENYNEYRQYLAGIGGDNSGSISYVRKNLLRAAREELTENQWEMVRLYYIEGFIMRDIADMLDVNVSTVSRTLKRGRDRLRRCLRYGAKELLNNSFET